MALLQKKICMLGRFGVGKTSLTRRFVYEKFDDAYLSTIGVKVNQKLLPPVKASSGEMVQHNFLIWDIEGIEESPTRPVSNYFIGASGAIVVCDLTRPDTIEALQDIIGRFRKVCPSAAMLIAGNKSDLVEEGAPAFSLLAEKAQQLELDFFVTSARQGDQVEACFQKIGLLLAE